MSEPAKVDLFVEGISCFLVMLTMLLAGACVGARAVEDRTAACTRPCCKAVGK